MDAQATFSYSFTQSDLGPVVELPGLPQWPAQRLLPQERRDLAIQVLAGAQPVSDLAREHEVSRKFLYQQAHTAEEALSEAFAPSSRSDDVLFYLPVTKAWLRQLVLALVLICHSSVRGVVELLRDVFDYRLSVGTVHNIVHSAVPPAQGINQQYDLSPIRVGLLDEIFQASDPVFVGVDAKSTFCFLLSPEQHCDADTWGIRLLELVDQGFAPDATVADFGAGLRAGHKEALPEFPAAVIFFMRCTPSGRWSATWRTGLTKPWTPGPSLSESKRPPDVVIAARRSRVWPGNYDTPGRLRPRRSRWLMRWRC